MFTMFRQYPIVIAETRQFRQSVKKVMTDEQISELIGHVAFHPEGGDVIEGTGGVRKLRWARPGMGKSGGLRVIYFFYDLNRPLYLITAYTKSSQETITDEDKKVMRRLTKALVDQRKATGAKEDDQ